MFYSDFYLRSDVRELYTQHCPQLYHFKTQRNVPILTFYMLSLFYINWILSIFPFFANHHLLFLFITTLCTASKLVGSGAVVLIIYQKHNLS